jgi:broad specificity phosphatase PhoE
MKLILVRHGNIKWRKIGYLSYTNIELTKTGRKNSYKVGLYLKNNFDIGVIYSSPLKRCIQTAEIISSIVNVSIHITNTLREVNFGIFEGLSKKEVKKLYPDIFDKRELDKWYYRIPNGESYFDAAKRIKRFLTMIKRNYYRWYNNLGCRKVSKAIIAVTHVTIIKIFIKLLTNLKLSEIEKIFFPPTSLTILDFNGKSWRLITLNKVV